MPPKHGLLVSTRCARAGHLWDEEPLDAKLKEYRPTLTSGVANLPFRRGVDHKKVLHEVLTSPLPFPLSPSGPLPAK